MVMITGIEDHDGARDTARTGGIKSIKRERSLKIDEGFVYPIQGVLLPSLKKRRSFQGRTRYFQISETGLSSDWELAHLWPPRFGDEAAAGIMAALKEMNQDFQNHRVEPWLQRLRSFYPGVEIEITASAACWKNEFLKSKGNPDYSKTEILKWVSYEISKCPTRTLSPIGEPLLGTSIKMQLEFPLPGYLPKISKIGADTLMSWNVLS